MLVGKCVLLRDIVGPAIIDAGLYEIVETIPDAVSAFILHTWDDYIPDPMIHWFCIGANNSLRTYLIYHPDQAM